LFTSTIFGSVASSGGSLLCAQPGKANAHSAMHRPAHPKRSMRNTEAKWAVNMMSPWLLD
jgi:hypothetical protein